MTYSVLIVEDEAKARGSMNRLLTADGYEVLEAPTLAKAMETLDSRLTDIVICDFNLPDGHGLDLLRRISATRPRPQTIVVTGHGSVATAVEATHLGAVDMLEKPLDPEQLRRVVQRASEVVRLQRELDALPHEHGIDRPREIQTTADRSGRREHVVDVARTGHTRDVRAVA